MLRLDFTKGELDRIHSEAGFNARELEVFKRLRDDHPNNRQSIVQIADQMHLGTATVSRAIRRIQIKIIRMIK